MRLLKASEMKLCLWGALGKWTGKIWAKLCHQILCKAWRICYCDLWKVTKGLWRTFPIQGTSVQIAQVLFRRPRTSGRRTSCGKTFNLKTDDSVERVRSLVRLNHWLTLRMISSELNLNRFTIPQMLMQDLDMRKVCAKMVPKNLTTEQKGNGGMCVLIFWITLRVSQNSSVALSQAMNHGFWSTIPRQTPKLWVAHCKLSPS